MGGGALMKQERHNSKTKCLLCGIEFSCRVQQDEPTPPAPINNLHKLLTPGDAAQLAAIQQLWQIPIKRTLSTLCMWFTQTWLPLSCTVRPLFYVCVRERDVQRNSAASIQHPCQMQRVDHLALVGPVEVKSFWVHLHGDRKGLCGVLWWRQKS